MQITINIPVKKYIFLIRKIFKKIEVKRFDKKNNLKLTGKEIDGISESLTMFPEFDLKKITLGYILNRKNESKL